MKSFVYKTIATSFIVICQLSFVNATFAQTEVTAGVTFGKKFGVTYMLPKTELVIEAQATKQTYQPGEFSRYAERYLRMGGVKQETETVWSLDKVTVKVVGVPDKENIYFVEMKDRTTAPLMELTPDGIVRSINLPYEGVKNTVQTEEPQPTELELDPRSFLTEEILTANSSAKMAELVAREIYNIRESKNALLRGEADNLPKDGAQLQIMLDNLNLQENILVITKLYIFRNLYSALAHKYNLAEYYIIGNQFLLPLYIRALHIVCDFQKELTLSVGVGFFLQLLKHTFSNLAIMPKHNLIVRIRKFFIAFSYSQPLPLWLDSYFPLS